jgi:hypothetical protein
MVYVILGILFVLVVVAAVTVQKRAGEARSKIDQALAQLDVLRQDKATFHGQTSLGEGQVRSVGALALTPDELVFLRFVPEGELRIPRAAITGAEASRSFLGKTHNRDLLVVTWSAGDGDDDVDGAAFEVADHEAWLADMSPAVG